MCDIHLDDSTRFSPGFRRELLRGHASLSDGRRELIIMDMVGVVTIGGLDVNDPQILDDMADHLHLLATRLRTRQAQPHHIHAPLRT